MPQVGVTGDKVVALVPSMLRSRPRADDVNEERGRVLLFTGVRYDRRIDLTDGEHGPAPEIEDHRS